MKRNLILLSLLSLSGLCMQATPLTPAEAVERVTASGARQIRTSEQAPAFRGVWTDKDGQNAVYLFTYSGDRGFMLVSADDAVTPLLAYSETNSFDMKNMSTDMESWLSLYTETVREARGGAPYARLLTRADDKAPIEPLIKTNWDQNYPYNRECPLMGNRYCVTGCVATAMAQVMNYWKYPAVGQGSLIYRPEDFDKDLEINFAETEFNWDLMENRYGYGSYDEKAKAVATLMKACGYSVKMSYSPVSSGANAKDIQNALTTYFGYDKGIARKENKGYSTEDWNNLMYSELTNVGPVIYSGQSSSGGHCFVCDGYDGNGYFHINWGWGGLSDGYFLLNELTPHDIGTGGHYGGYNLSQSIITGVMPPVGRISLENIAIDNCADDSGNVKGWGYTYRVNDFSNILLSVELKISGGHVNVPLLATIYETDPDTKRNGDMVYEEYFDKNVESSDGTVTQTHTVRMKSFDPSKFYTLNVAYFLKGQRTTIGSIKLAASSGVDEVWSEGIGLTLRSDNRTLIVESALPATVSVYDLGGAKMAERHGSNPVVDLGSLEPGIYIAKAVASDGTTRTLKLLLK